ncbi:MAG: DUF882 domain-containing protein [bacterium]|nr:DUF882 domain-containing protein [bacterium]
MSKMLSDRIKVALSVVIASGAFLFAPGNAGARTCDVMVKSFRCMSGVVEKKAALKKSYKVASIRPTRILNDASRSVVKSKPKVKSKSKSKSRVKIRSTRQKKGARRSVRKRRVARRTKKSFGKNKSLRKIGRRLNARSVRKLTRRGSAKRKSAKRKTASKKTKRGWRTRSKGLGYQVAKRGVSTSCFPKRLRNLLKKVSAHYGRKLHITSGYRSHRHNRRIGGARRSQHLHCTAADFYVPGINKYALARYLKSLPGRGGVGTYGGNRIVHLDVGPRRSWHWGGRKKRHASKKRRYRSKRRVSRVKRARRIARKRRMARLRDSLS